MECAHVCSVLQMPKLMWRDN